MSFSLLLFVPIALLLYYFIKRQGFEYLSKVWLVGGGIIFYIIHRLKIKNFDNFSF